MGQTSSCSGTEETRLCCVVVEIDLVSLRDDFAVIVGAACCTNVVWTLQLAAVWAFSWVAGDQSIVGAAHVPLGAGDFILRDSHVATSGSWGLLRPRWADHLSIITMRKRPLFVRTLLVR